MQDGSAQNKLFAAVLPYENRFFITDMKLVSLKNIQIMKTCCVIVVSKLRVVLQMCLQTISSVLPIDCHLKPVCVCMFNLGSLHIIINIVITLYAAGLCNLNVGMNHISEHLNEYPLKTTKIG